MPVVTDISAWADQLQVVRLPALDTRLDAVVTLSALNAATLSNKSQEFNDRLDEHTVRLDVLNDSTESSRLRSVDALTRVYGSELSNKLYIDSEIQKLSDLFTTRLVDATETLQTNVSNEIASELSVVVNDTSANIAASTAYVDSIKATLSADYTSFNSVTNDLFNLTMPKIDELQGSIFTDVASTKGRIDTLLAEYTFDTIIEGMDLVRTDLGVSIGENSGNINQILALDADYLDGSVMGTMLTQLNVDANGTVAGITDFGIAVADLFGKASAAYTLRVVAGGQEGALEIVAWEDADGINAGSAIQLTSDNIFANGALSAKKLAVGTGRNLLVNSDFIQGIGNLKSQSSGDQTTQTSVSLKTPGLTYTDGISPTLNLYQLGDGNTGSFNVGFGVYSVNNTIRPIPIEKGKTYEFSANAKLLRANGSIRLDWYNADQLFMYTDSTPYSDVSVVHDDPDSWPRIFSRAVAPEGALYCMPTVTKAATLSGISSNLFISKPMFSKVHEDVTEVTEYEASGLTIIDGSTIRTGTMALNSLQSDVLSANNIVGGTMSIARVTVDEVLKIDANTAGFAMSKVSPYDPTDGVYMGRTLEPNGSAGFGLAMSRTEGFIKQSFEATQRNGLRVENGAFFRNISKSESNFYENSTTFNLDPTTRTISFGMIAGGSGGSSGNGLSGSAGGNTTVRVRDGTSIVKTWICSGGSESSAGSLSGNGQSGESSVWGVGGESGKHEYYTYSQSNPNSQGDTFTETTINPAEDGGNATGYGAGGGGGGHETQAKGGKKGLAGQFLNISEYDVSNLTNPNIVVTIGAAGLGNTSGSKNGGNGSPGGVEITQNTNTPERADVIPIAATASGSFVNNSGVGNSFPDLGAGFWVISASGTNRGNTVEIEIDDTGIVFNANYGSSFAFVSTKTPFVLPGSGTRTFSYKFHKMGE